LAGVFEEIYRPARLRAQTNAQVVISPWSDHILEAYDPVLARAAVKGACAAVGKPVPAAPTAWRWRFAGLVLGVAGAFGLMFRLPELHPRLARTRRYVVPAVLLIALGLTLGTWIGVTPQLRRIPQQLVLLPVVTGILALGCLALAFASAKNIIVWFFSTLMCTFVISTLLLLPAVAVGRIATRGGSRRDGDVAMAIFASYCIGQFMPLFY
jgi:Na+/melibiose symporter-like transporter